MRQCSKRERCDIAGHGDQEGVRVGQRRNREIEGQIETYQHEERETDEGALTMAMHNKEKGGSELQERIY